MLTLLWIAPKKTKGEKMDLGTFLTDSSMLWRPRRTNGDITTADEASSPGFMGRRNGGYANAMYVLLPIHSTTTLLMLWLPSW